MVDQASPRVFTLFNHGTASHRSRRDGELITRLGEAAHGKEYRDYLILDGPGCTTDDPSDPMPGTFDPYSRCKTPKVDLRNRNPEMGFSYAHPIRGWTRAKRSDRKEPVFLQAAPALAPVLDKFVPSRTTALLTGAGWDDNIRHAIAAITERGVANKLPDVVNIVGWSRGAVTGIRIAHRLHEIYPRIVVNLFGIDPVVGGPGHMCLREMAEIPPNVRHAVLTIAVDERWRGFKAQDMSRVKVANRRRTRVVFLPFPGDHGAQVLAPHPYLTEATEIVGSLAHRFLTYHGSSLRRGFQKSSATLLERYAALFVRRRRYRWDASTPLGRSRRINTVADPYDPRNKPMSKYVAHHDVFINEHHRLLFRTCLPDLYGAMFKLHGSSKPGLRRDLEGLIGPSRAFPNTYAHLTGLGIFERESQGKYEIVTEREERESHRWRGFAGGDAATALERCGLY